MSKYITRLFKVKSKFLITVEIHKLEVDLKQQLLMSVIFERGPQTDETLRFVMNRDKTVQEINQKFQRVSGFYFDKNIQRWEEKVLYLKLGYQQLG